MTEEGDDGRPVGGPAFGGTGTAIRRHWDDLIGDMEATAAEFRAAGWEVLELHPADVTVVTEPYRGFDVLVPDDEFERLREWVQAATFPDHDVYRAEAGIVFLLAVMQAPDAERAVCCPLYYERGEAEALRQFAAADGELRTHVRRLSEEYVHITHGEPDPFLPAE